MEIRASHGEELTKSQAASPEEFFNRSEVVYFDKGQEHSLELLYLRYFDERMNEFMPYEENPIMSFGETKIDVKDVAALVALIKNPRYKHKRKIYINDYDEYAELYANINWESLQQMLLKLSDGKPYELESTLAFIHG
ncbi:hypothetical protein [Thalassobacillus hwangdonensis]|uniref:Uncharacterized protein n=1 Tax=Thalassobacillus hwangdonensis TaxID=546108 RepID=A0ABW3KZA4_9BACI